MSAKIADFNIRFNAESAEFSRDVDYAKKMLRGYTQEAKAANDSTGGFDQSLSQATNTLRDIGRTTLQVTGMLSAGFGAVVTASGYMVRQSADQAREIERMANVAQVSVERIQALAYATEQYGVSGDKLADILKDVNDKLGDFKETGGGEFKDFMENIAPTVGLTIDQLQRMAGPEALVAIKEAMDAANVPMKSQIFYLESIADDTTALLPLLEDKGKRLYELTQRYEDMNIAMSRIDINEFKYMDQQIGDMEKRMEKAFRDLARQVTYSLMPTLEDVNEFVGGLTRGVKDYTDQIKALGIATATMNVFSGESLREHHRETFGEYVALKEELQAYDGVNVDELPELNLLPGGLSQNHFRRLNAELALKRDELKRINDTIIEEKKRISSLFDSEESSKSGSSGNRPDKPSTKDDSAEKLNALDLLYASEREKLQLAHQQRLSDINTLNVSEAELKRQGFDSIEALRREYAVREQIFFDEQQKELQRKQDEAMQRELDALVRKEEEKTRIEEREARQRAATEKRLDDQVLAMKYGVAAQGLALIEQTAREGSFIQKAAFAAQKAMAAMQVIQQGEVAAAAALAPPPLGLGPVAGDGKASFIRSMSMASAALIMGQALAGMAHNGISSVPREGTWLLDKGERVYTNDSARQLDQMYRAIMSMHSRQFAANDAAFNAGSFKGGGGNVYTFTFPMEVHLSGRATEEDAKVLNDMVSRKVHETLMNEKRPGGALWTGT